MPQIQLWVLSRLDYCNSILSGSSKCLIKKLQKIHNAALRITLRIPRTEHTTPQYVTLLPISKICLGTFNTCKTTVFIIRPKHPQHSYNKDQVIQSANICIPSTQQLEQCHYSFLLVYFHKLCYYMSVPLTRSMFVFMLCCLVLLLSNLSLM